MMMIGHLPVGYLLSTALIQKWHVTNNRLRDIFVALGMMGATFPDIDMLYYYLLDNKQHHHHGFFTHYPIVWVIFILTAYLLLKNSSAKTWGILAMIFSINGFVHMMLDSVVGDVRWLAPFSNHPFSLFYVPPKYTCWWFSFIFHWSFLIEIFVTVLAVFVYRKRKYRERRIERRREAFSVAT